MFRFLTVYPCSGSASAIKQLTTVAHNHQGNNLPESLWSMAFPRVRAMLLDMFGDTSEREAFVLRFWALALVLHVNYVCNRLPSAHLPPRGHRMHTAYYLRTEIN